MMQVATLRSDTVMSGYEALPVTEWGKVELHRHIEGSVRFETAWFWAQRSPSLKGLSREELRQRVQFDGVVGYEHFLKKFDTLRHLYYDTAAVEQVMREAVEDAARDNVRYLELRVSPDHFSRQAGFDVYETAALLFGTGQRVGHELGVKVRYLCTITRNYSPETCETILDIALSFRNQGVVGFDLAGNENLETGAHVRRLLERAAGEGLGISVHAGEAGSVAKVWEAINDLYANRIAHGISSIRDTALMETLRDRNITLEVCPTSNLHTGATATVEEHPLRTLVEAGVPLVVGTDDPGISRVSLSDEYDLALEVLSLPRETMADLIIKGAQSSFLPGADKAELVTSLQQELGVLV